MLEVGTAATPSSPPSIISFSMSFGKSIHASSHMCAEHPFFPVPFECMKCSFFAYHREHAAETQISGASNRASSLYPEPSNDRFCSNGPHHNPFQTSMRYAVPTVNTSKSFKPTIISKTILPKTLPAPITTKSRHDHYPERFALSPRDRPTMYAGNFYTDKLALSPVEENDSEEDAECESDPGMPEAPAIVVEKTAEKLSPLLKLPKVLSKSSQHKCKEDSDSESFEVESKLISVSKKTGDQFYDVDTIKGDKPKSNLESGSKSDYEDDGPCAICRELTSKKLNEIIFCDGCNLAFHQKCYGVPEIPDGDWFCKDCRTQEKDKQKTDQSTKPPKAKKDEQKVAQSTKHRRNSHEVEEAEQQSVHRSKRSRIHSIVVISDDPEEEQKLSR